MEQSPITETVVRELLASAMPTLRVDLEEVRKRAARYQLFRALAIGSSVLLAAVSLLWVTYLVAIPRGLSVSDALKAGGDEDPRSAILGVWAPVSAPGAQLPTLDPTSAANDLTFEARSWWAPNACNVYSGFYSVDPSGGFVATDTLSSLVSCPSYFPATLPTASLLDATSQVVIHDDHLDLLDAHGSTLASYIRISSDNGSLPILPNFVGMIGGSAHALATKLGIDIRLEYERDAGRVGTVIAESGAAVGQPVPIGHHITITIAAG